MLSARVLSIEEFFKLGIFIPASVQRDYVWDKQQSEDLFNDIDRASQKIPDDLEDGADPDISHAGEEAARDSNRACAMIAARAAEETTPAYHLGGIMICRSGNGNFEIYDGLQRATTLTILLCIIRDQTRSADLKKRIQSLIRAGKDHRITLPGSDKTLLTEIQSDGQALKRFRRAVSARGERIRVSRSLFHGYIDGWDEDRLSQFGAFLLERTLFVVAETEDRALARQAFITANNRGIFLRPIDIFKGQMLDLASDETTASEIVDRWNGISKIVGDQLDVFMQAYDFVQRCEPQGSDHLTRLTEHIKQAHGPTPLPSVLDEIKDYASAWEELHAKLEQPANPIVEPDVWKLRFFKWFEWKPLALAWFKDLRDGRAGAKPGSAAKSENTFKARFAALHRACMAISLAKFSAADRATIFCKAVKQWRRGRDPFSLRGKPPGALTFSPVQQARIAETLRTPLYDEEIRLSLLRWIEAVEAGEKPRPELASASVEHVLPQRPDPKSQWLKEFPDDEERFSACHSIGNLAVMDHEVNKDLTNKEYHLKRSAIREQARKYRTLLDIAAKDKWTAEAIKDRANTMIKRVLKELNFPSTPS